tara:strand:+ start:413 stop:658 length:246 start_codon:yes stop_codon:yes gene_type:complete
MPTHIKKMKMTYPFEGYDETYTDECMELVKRVAMTALNAGVFTNLNGKIVAGEVHLYIDDSGGTYPQGDDKPIYIDEEGNY